MVQIVQDDAPWSFGFFPYASAAAQSWVHNSKPAILIRDHGRYLRLDVAAARGGAARVEQAGVVADGAARPRVVAAGCWYARRSLRRRERMNARGEVLA